MSRSEDEKLEARAAPEPTDEHDLDARPRADLVEPLDEERLDDLPPPPPTGAQQEEEVRPLPWNLDGALARTDKSVLVLAAVITLWVAVFGLLVWRRHDRFSSFGFDMGIFDQAIWLLSRGSQFITVRGLPAFGHHASFAFYLLVPFYWLGAGPQFLNLFQVTTMAAGAIPVFLLARHRLNDKWMAVLLAAAFLAHPALQFMAWELFHPETVAITFVLFAYWFSVRERWGWFAAMAVIAVMWKEDVTLVVLLLGVVIALRGHRRQGLLTIGLAAAWFLFVTQFLLPRISGSHAFYLSFFSDLGDSPTEIAGNLIRHPSRLGRRVFAPDAKSYLWKMTAPFGLLPIASPTTLLLGVPQTLLNLLSVNNFTRVIFYHYAALPLTALILATVEGIAKISRTRPHAKGVLVGFVAACSLVATISWGLSPIGEEYRQGWWPLGEDSRRASKEAALEMVPENAGVSATYQFVAHLTHRKKIFEYPNPFKPSNWGVDNENYPSENEATWLVIDTQLIGPDDEVLDEQISSGEFAVRLERDGIIVAERVRQAPPGQRPAGTTP